MKKLTFIIIFLLTCSGIHAEPLKIGVVVPLTGRAAWHGDATVKGINLYLKQYPQFDKKVKIIVEDLAIGNTTRGIQGIRKMVEADGISLLIIETSQITQAVSPDIERWKLPTIAITGADTARNSKYQKRLWLTASAEAAALTDIIRKYSSFSVITTEQPSMVDRSEALFKLLIKEGKGGSISKHSVTNIDDLPMTALKVVREKLDCTIMNLMPGEYGVIIKELKKLGYRGKIVGNVVIASKEERKLAPELFKGIPYSDCYVDKEFVKIFQNSYGKDPLPGASNGYDAMGLIHQTLKKFDYEIDTEEINEALKVDSFTGSMGRYGFSEDEGNIYTLKAVLKTVD